jgi:hypothetical protein
MMKGNSYSYVQNPKDHNLFATGMNTRDIDNAMGGRPANHQLFASGMSGDEDLGQEITMKGQKYKYNQRPGEVALFATGMNGDEDMGQEITMKGQKYKYHQV